MKNFKPLHNASTISNYVKNDKICDYLNIIAKNNYEVNDDLIITKKRIIKQPITKTSLDYIMENGIIYENEIMKQIKEMMEKNGEINKLYNVPKTNNFRKFQITLD